MSALITRKGTAISIVQDQDVLIVDIDTSDLTITLIGAAGADNVKHVADIHVSNQVCRQSRYLRSIIELSDDPTEITLGGETKRSGANYHGQEEGENCEGLLVVLAHMHGLTEERMKELGLYKISVLGVWYAIAYQEREQRGSTKGALKKWFEVWYAASMEKAELDVHSARALALPCQFFDHAVAFARVTRWLAYNHIGAVKERPPVGFKGSEVIHLPPGGFVGAYYSNRPYCAFD